jgi:hypothetical protein
MTALSKTSRTLALIFTLLTLLLGPGFFFAHLYARSDGLPMLLASGLFTILFGVATILLYWSYRYSRSPQCNPRTTILLWVFIAAIGLLGAAFALRIFQLGVLPLFHATAA